MVGIVTEVAIELDEAATAATTALLVETVALLVATAALLETAVVATAVAVAGDAELPDPAPQVATAPPGPVYVVMLKP